MELGADGVELDVHASADARLVVMHDVTLRPDDFGERFGCDERSADIKRLDAGSWFGAEHAGEPVPFLEDVLQLTAERFEIQLKGFTAEFVDAVVDTVLAKGRSSAWSSPLPSRSYWRWSAGVCPALGSECSRHPSKSGCRGTFTFSAPGRSSSWWRRRSFTSLLSMSMPPSSPWWIRGVTDSTPLTSPTAISIACWSWASRDSRQTTRVSPLHAAPPEPARGNT